MFMSCPWSCNVILFITWSCSKRIIGLRWWNHVKSLQSLNGCVFDAATTPHNPTGPDLILIWIHFYHESMEEDKYHTGWWFGTFFIFPYIGNNHPNWLKFVRGVETTNQHKSEHVWTVLTVSTGCPIWIRGTTHPATAKHSCHHVATPRFAAKDWVTKKFRTSTGTWHLPAGAGYRMVCCARVMGKTITNRIHRPHKLEYGGFLA